MQQYEARLKEEIDLDSAARQIREEIVDKLLLQDRTRVLNTILIAKRVFGMRLAEAKLFVESRCEALGYSERDVLREERRAQVKEQK